MTKPASEPAVACDPKKLRRTAWVLVSIMVVGGVLVYIAYLRWAAEKYRDDRPAIIHRIQPERSLRVVRQDGKTGDLVDLRGSVTVLQVACVEQPASSALSTEVMKRLAAKHRGNDGFHLVTLLLDPMDPDRIVSRLAEEAGKLEATMPQWWVAGTEPQTLQTFIRKELKPSVVPERVNGTWLYDASIVLIDKNGHLRRAVVPQVKGGPPYIAAFDFDQAAQWDRDHKLSGTGRTNCEELEQLLEKTIVRLLEEPYQPQ